MYHVPLLSLQPLQLVTVSSLLESMTALWSMTNSLLIEFYWEVFALFGRLFLLQTFHKASSCILRSFRKIISRIVPKLIYLFCLKCSLSPELWTSGRNVEYLKVQCLSKNPSFFLAEIWFHFCFFGITACFCFILPFPLSSPVTGCYSKSQMTALVTLFLCCLSTDI